MTSYGRGWRVDRAGTTQAQSSFDIVVNNFNYGRYVADAIESVPWQTHAHVNVIVVDDGLSDGSPELLSDFEGTGRPRAQGERRAGLGGQRGLRDAAPATWCSSSTQTTCCCRKRRRSSPARFAADPRVAKVQFRMEVIDRDGQSLDVVKPPSSPAAARR